MNAKKPVFTSRLLTGVVLALALFPAVAVLPAQEPGQYVAYSSSPYGQWQAPSNYRQQREVHYYTPGEYLPVPGAVNQPQQNAPAPAPKPTPAPPQTVAPTAPLLPPYAYPPNVKKQAAEQAAAAPKPVAPVQGGPRPAANTPEEIEALKRENYLLNQQLVAMQNPKAAQQTIPVPGRVAYVKHAVRHGDSLWGLALRYRTTVTAIREFNALGHKDKLIEGRVIGIPVRDPGAEKANAAFYQPPAPPPPLQEAPKTTQPTAVAWGKHIVKPNETLSLIAQHYNVSTRSMQVANGLKSPNRIYVGQELVVPGRSATEVAEAAKKPVPVAPAPVHPGTAPKEPKAKTSSQVQGTSAAYVPPAPPVNRTPASSSSSHLANRGITSYRIRKSDTIESISKSYNLSPTEIAAFNRLPNNKLPPVGEEILLPTPVIASL
ncbi:MAG: LysM peptidoglycan-binding domain-containing protein [Verrucomicrobiaceae bacterium]|nr:LysM peptidoglycan-binding domain-containing protein [Verrucomicrobiaceae bacterium]